MHKDELEINKLEKVGYVVISPNSKKQIRLELKSGKKYKLPLLLEEILDIFHESEE